MLSVLQVLKKLDTEICGENRTWQTINEPRCADLAGLSYHETTKQRHPLASSGSSWPHHRSRYCRSLARTLVLLFPHRRHEPQGKGWGKATRGLSFCLSSRMCSKTDPSKHPPLRGISMINCIFPSYPTTSHCVTGKHWMRSQQTHFIEASRILCFHLRENLSTVGHSWMRSVWSSILTPPRNVGVVV